MFGFGVLAGQRSLVEAFRSGARLPGWRACRLERSRIARNSASLRASGALCDCLAVTPGRFRGDTRARSLAELSFGARSARASRTASHNGYYVNSRLQIKKEGPYHRIAGTGPREETVILYRCPPPPPWPPPLLWDAPPDACPVLCVRVAPLCDDFSRTTGGATRMGCGRAPLAAGAPYGRYPATPAAGYAGRGTLDMPGRGSPKRCQPLLRSGE